jgi:NAD(P)-dependent dehydrogenase (short-subunit alcohol dehydrogenase family)
MLLAGKVAVITGAGSGIGQAIAERFSAEGARVVVADVNEASANNTLKLLKAKEGDSFAVKTDVSDSSSVMKLFDQLDQRNWPVDILVNNAGTVGESKRVHELDDAQWASLIATHLNGTFYCTRESLKRMIPRRCGTVINMGSVAGLVGLPRAAAYTAAKGGIMAFTKAVAREVASFGIRVNCIAPGWIDTPLLARFTNEDRTALTKMTPLGRLGTTQEIASVAAFLATDEASFMVGQTVSPNGGIST